MPSPSLMLGAFLAAVAMSAAATGLSLRLLRRLASRQHIREDVPETHREKAGTPSLGGAPMLAAIFVAATGIGLATGNLSARVALCLLLTVAFALVGLADDLQKLDDSKSKGILARYRIGVEVIAAGLFAAAIAQTPGSEAQAASWLGAASWPAGAAAVLGILVVVGASNALNLTDGLDGLASGLSAIAALALGVATLALGQSDLALLSVVIAGGAAGFLVLNAKPAKVWMGDVGSLGLGTVMAAVAVAARIEFLFAIIGAVFVVEALSVILQVISFKSTGKRIFRMSPLHHHFELCGWGEARIVAGFWLAGVVAAVAGLALLWVSSPGG